MKSIWNFESARSLTVEHSAGPLNIRGHDRDEIFVSAISEPRYSAPDEDTVSFRFRGPSILKAPDDTEITVDEAAGPLSIKKVRAGVAIGDTRGPLHIANLDGPLTCTGSVFGPTRIARAGCISLNSCVGPMSASDINSIDLNDSSGPVHVSRCSGPFRARRLAGDATLRDMSGSVEIDRHAGSLRLGGLLRGDSVWKVTTQGSVTISLDGASSARLKLVSETKDVSVHELELSDRSHVHEDGLFTATIGDGEATLEIEASGEIVLRRAGGSENGKFGLPFSAQEIAEDVEYVISGVESDLRDLGEEVSQSLRIGDDFRNLGGRIRKRVQRDVDRFVRRQRKRVRRAARKSVEPQPRRPQMVDGSSDDHAENVRTVLRLVAEGKISPYEAEKLLNALSSRQ
ncbi:MAG: hypothetical protein OXG46_07240 [Chloroflexi bacterium]|nr:hypothetical protein [Chloroflexota bacterium]MCY3936774.1 hypothetical protein [Chloroflexota bacterium]